MLTKIHAHIDAFVTWLFLGAFHIYFMWRTSWIATDNGNAISLYTLK